MKLAPESVVTAFRAFETLPSENPKLLFSKAVTLYDLLAPGRPPTQEFATAFLPVKYGSSGHTNDSVRLVSGLMRKYKTEADDTFFYALSVNPTLYDSNTARSCKDRQTFQLAIFPPAPPQFPHDDLIAALTIEEFRSRSALLGMAWIPYDIQIEVRKGAYSENWTNVIGKRSDIKDSSDEDFLYYQGLPSREMVVSNLFETLIEAVRKVPEDYRIQMDRKLQQELLPRISS